MLQFELRKMSRAQYYGRGIGTSSLRQHATIAATTGTQQGSGDIAPIRRDEEIPEIECESHEAHKKHALRLQQRQSFT